MKSISSLALAASVASLLLSFLTGANQILGFFTKISIPTALVSAALGVAIVFGLPSFLREKYREFKVSSRLSLRTASAFLGIAVILSGVGPFLGKAFTAKNAWQAGQQFLDRHRYGPAKQQLVRASAYFGDIGLEKQAAETKLLLLQAVAGLGDWELAEEFISSLDRSKYLDGYLQAKLYAIRGSLAYELGQFELAERFYQIAHQTIEPGTQAHAALLQNQGVLWSGKGQLYRERASMNFIQAREIYQDLGDRIGMAQILVNQGTLFENQPETARSLYKEALRLTADLDDPQLTGTIQLNIGRTYRQQGELDQAERFYRTAQLSFEESADLLGQANVLVNLASIEWERGHGELAKQLLQASDAYLANIDPESELIHPREIARNRTFMADIYDSLGETQIAEQLYKEALSTFSKHPDTLNEVSTQLNYAGLLIRLNRSEQARSILGRAREILETSVGEGPHQALGVLWNNLGKVYQDSGDYPSALTLYQNAQATFEALDDPFHYAEARENIGVLLGFQGDLLSGAEAVSQALAIYGETGNRDHQAKALFNLYTLQSGLGQSVAPLLDQIMTLLAEYAIDHETEAGILFGILTQDISEEPQLNIYRERLNQLRLYYEEREDPIGLGRSLLKLAEVEQRLGNTHGTLDYAREAEQYSDWIPLPLRISFHTDLGFYLLDEDPQDAIDHFLEAFDLAAGIDPTTQRNLAIVVETYISVFEGQLDRERYLTKAERIVQTSQDPMVVATFERIAELLRSEE